MDFNKMLNNFLSANIQNNPKLQRLQYLAKQTRNPNELVNILMKESPEIRNIMNQFNGSKMTPEQFLMQYIGQGFF